MMPGPTHIRKCPHCEHPVAQDSFSSGNTFGASFWSDGRMIAPMLPDTLELVKCPNCLKLFWFNKAKLISKIDGGYLDTRSGALFYKDPSAQDYISFAEASKLPKKLAKYVRIQAWWKANDHFRDITPESEEDLPDPAEKLSDEAFRKNLEALAGLLDPNNCQDRIMAIEIARELGDFTKAEELLEDEKNHLRVINILDRLVKSRKSQVALMNDEVDK